jgi:hypothetical protein
MNTPEIQQTEQIWNSLEIAKLVISILTPIIIAFIAFRFNKIIKRLDKQQWTNQKIVEKRIEIYDKIVPKLNDMLCFYCYIGNWKDISPMDVIRLKRKLDKEINIYAPLFSNSLIEKYYEFIHLCFKSFSGWGQDAKIKSLYENRQEHNKKWEENWIEYFDTNNVTDPKILRDNYSEMMDTFKKDLIIFQSGLYPEGVVPSINFN